MIGDGVEPLGPLIGRDDELSLAEALLAETRLVSLVGAGGAGKTRLALEIASRRKRSGLPVAVVDLAGIRDAAHLPAQVAAVLPSDPAATEGVTDWDEARLVQELRSHGPLLLVLDNLEQVRGAAQHLHRMLLDVVDLRILATSRLRVGVQTETEVAIGPLRLPDGDAPPEVAAAPATALFLARAREIGRLRELDPVAAAEVAALARALDGLPLALELAAARTRLLTPGAILRRLRSASDVLVGVPGDTGPHRSLEAVMDWSFGLLSDSERRLLVAVAWCLGPFDLATAERLGSGRQPLDVLERLVMHGLVRVDPALDGEPRFRLLATVRASCLRRIPPGEAQTHRRRHARAMLEVVAVARDRLVGGDAGRTIADLELRLDDVRFAFDNSLDERPEVAVRLVAEAWRFWPVTGRLREGMDRLRAALAAERRPSRARGLGLAALAGFEGRLSGHRASRANALEALSIARRVRDRRIALEALPALALAAVEDGDLAAARRYASQLMETASAEGDEASRIRGLACLGVAEGTLGDARAGIAFLRDAVTHAQLLGDPLNEALQLGNLAQLELMSGQPRASVVHARAAAAIYRAHGLRVEVCGSLALLGTGLAHLDRLEDSRGALREAVALARALDSPSVIASVLLASLPYARRVGAASLTARLWGAAERGMRLSGAGISADDRRLAQRELNSVLATLGPDALAAAVHAGQSGGHSPVLDELSRLLASRADAGRATRVPGSVLTARETEVLQMVGEGLSDQAIAARLGISPKTVSVHVSNVKAKLGAASRVQVAMAARALDDAVTASPA